jgi:adenine-specific DNA-methyltransferase
MLTTELDRTRVQVSRTLDPKRRSKLGQFMTPSVVAGYMAARFSEVPSNVRLLDAGAGMGALTAAFVSHASRLGTPPASIDVTTYEVDKQLAAILAETLASCSATCSEHGIAFTSRIIADDYILQSAEPLLSERRTYNCAILNPPYGKILSSSEWRTALRQSGIETVNLYSAFVALAIQQMDDNGEIVAITPRSFCNGSYYEPFRRIMLRSTALLALHVFESRKSAFKDDEVLQENVIFHIRKGVPQQEHVTLSTDIVPGRAVSFAEIVRIEDKHSFIRLPVGDNDLAARMQALPCSLADLGINVSTGKVVDFRTREHLRKMPEHDTVPLIYAAHFDNGTVQGPISEYKKFNALADNRQTASLILAAGVYVLTKRLTAKEEKRRVVAAVYSGGRVGFDNKLNYFHENGKPLELRFARGLSAFLNSQAVDEYFRIFSGHTQVNATDLRNLYFPTKKQLEALADAPNVDEAVEALL